MSKFLPKVNSFNTFLYHQLTRAYSWKESISPNQVHIFEKKIFKKSLTESHLVSERLAWQKTLFRSSHRRCSVKEGVLKNFSNFTGKKACVGVSF